MGTKKQMTKDDTGFLWQKLARYKRAKERGHKSAERLLDETYENFGFFGTLLPISTLQTVLSLRVSVLTLRISPKNFQRCIKPICRSENTKLKLLHGQKNAGTDD